MKAEEIQSKLSGDFIEEIYGFCYRHCGTSYEAEDLCQDILVSAVKSLSKKDFVENVKAYVWTVAHHVYSDFCEKRKKYKDRIISYDEKEDRSDMQEDCIEEYLQNEEDRILADKIMQRIMYLSKAYREVMILYYLENMKISRIAERLACSETTVKQRLFSARNIIRKEVKFMKTDNINTLKLIDMAFIGTGNPIGNDPQTKAERTFSKNLLYLCRKKAMTAKELAEKLSVPMIFVEEELEIQVNGENGRYGLLRKEGRDKYISNIVIFDPDTKEKATGTYLKYVDILSESIEKNLKKYKEKITGFPFVNTQNDTGFILWSIISRAVWSLEDKVGNSLKERLGDDVEDIASKREFSTIAFAYDMDKGLYLNPYGCDGIWADNICGYKNVFITNVYGKYIEKHFSCGHNIANDMELMTAIKAINGLKVSELSEEESEIAAKAVKQGYIIRSGDMLYPKVLVVNAEDKSNFEALSDLLFDNVDDISKNIAADLEEVMKENLPQHLINEYGIFNMGASIPILGCIIEKCIERGVMKAPENKTGAEGTVIFIKA